MNPGKNTSMNTHRIMIFLMCGIFLISSIACSAAGLAGFRSDGETAEEVVSDADAGVEPDSGLEEASSVEPEDLDSEDNSEPDPAELLGNSGCGNVFYPMVLDQQWIYQVTSGDEQSKLGMTVSSVSEDLAVLNILAYDTGVTTSAEVVCENGAIINFPNLMLGFLFGDVDGDIELEHVDGVYAPSYQDLEANDWEYEWETEYIASGVLTAVSDGEAFSAVLADSPVHMEWETRGDRESVEVEAGTFSDAVVVERKTEFEASLTLEFEGDVLSLEGTVILETKMWFVPFQGLMKQEVTRTQLKLGPAVFPVESDTVVELVAFYPVE